MTPAAAEETCLILVNQVCVVWDATFSFWEVLATVAVSGLVTWVTIYFSVKAARDSTARQLEAALEAEHRERADRDEREARESRRISDQARGRLAASLIRVVQQVESTLGREPQDPAYLAVRAEWAALRVQFETSGEDNSAEFYEFADLTIAQGDEALPRFRAVSGEQLSVVETLSRQAFATNLSHLALDWARDPSAAPPAQQLEALRAWRAENRVASYERVLGFLAQLDELREQADDADRPNPN